MRPQEQVALSVATEYYVENKKTIKSILNENVISVYKDTLENGILNKEDSDLKAVSVGEEFGLFHVWELTGINLKETGVKVQVEDMEYRLYIGETFEDSRKIDDLLDRIGGKSTNDFKC